MGAQTRTALQTSGVVHEQEHFQYPCEGCGRARFLDVEGLCFDCSHLRFGPKYSFYASVSAEGEDSRDPGRIADGTAGFNLALPGVDREVGRRKNGKAALEYRPITHNELGTRRAREDYARRHGLEPVNAPKRAIGGR